LGDPEMAERLVDEAVSLARRTDFLTLHADALGDRAEVRWLLGRPAEAMDDQRAAVELYERKGASVLADRFRRPYAGPATDRAGSPPAATRS
jgi:hypothetical protein